MSKKVVK